jgi:type IV pilus assembly protein PilV
LSKKGFTLIEVLVALVIFTLGALALASMQVVSTKGSSFSKQATVATTLAQKKMEELRNTPYGSITSDATGVTEQDMVVTWTIVENGTAPCRYKNIAVTVTWTGKSIILNTIRSEV